MTDDASVTAAVSVVVVAYGATPGLPVCVDHLLASVKADVDIVVVDNGSTDGSVDAVSGLPGARVVDAGVNLGFGGGCNRGVAASDRPFVAFVNPDVLVEPDALVRLVDEAASPDVGIASASVRLQHKPELMNSAGDPSTFSGWGGPRATGSRFRRPWLVRIAMWSPPAGGDGHAPGEVRRARWLH